MEVWLAQSLKSLDHLREEHLQVADALFKVNAGILMFDLLTVASLNRSMCLLRGFRTLVQSGNFIAAAPLLRVQIDTYLRYSAGRLVADCDEFALRVLEGVPVRQQKDRAGKRMTDQYLCDQAAKEHPWIADLYNDASGYVHLSEKHYWNAIIAKEQRFLDMKVTDKDAFVSPDQYSNAVQAFADVTSLLLWAVSGWIAHRNTLPGPAPSDGAAR